MTSILIILSLIVYVSSQTTSSKTELKKLFSETELGNILPQFKFMQGAIEGGSIGVPLGGGKGTPIPFTPDDSCTDDIFEGMNEDLRSPQLPYLTQDLWGCEREEKTFDAYNLESDDLIVTVTPQWSGKVWSIYDKKRKRDILYNNRAHQPANIGALKAWAAGGAEWNWSPGIIGHSAFSESQTYLAKTHTPYGTGYRVYEYDRYNGTVWQVDMLLVNETFYVHPKITNPTPVDLRGYWWTCVAVESKPTTRIFTPATHVAQTSRNPMRNAQWPVYAEAIENASFVGTFGDFQDDLSYLGNHQLGDMFLRIPKDSVYTPYIGHTDIQDESGYTLIHGHPLNGTKFFTWGQSGPGRFMQDFLAGGGKRQGDYTELQVGPAPTQMQTFALPKDSSMQWTEWFKGFNGDTAKLKSNEYSNALDHIDEWMRSNSGMPKSTLDDIDNVLKSLADKPIAKEDILVHGSGWGALEEMRIAIESGHYSYQLASGLNFELPNKDEDHQGYREIQPWLELLQKGTFSDDTLNILPSSYQTTDAWMNLIQNSLDKYGETWLHNLHLGIGYTERGEVKRPLELFKKSIKLKETAVAYRNIAVLQSDVNNAWKYFQKAFDVAINSGGSTTNKGCPYYRSTRNLVVEICNFLQEQQWYNELKSFLDKVPSEHTDLDLYLSSKAHVLIDQGKKKEDDGGPYFDEALTLLGKHCFPTYAGARDDLMNMWNEASEGKAAVIKGTSLTNKEAHRVRIEQPVPDNIGCKYASEYCINYW